MEREACFLDNNDLGRLGCTSSLLYKVVSIALTMWAVWDPAVPGGGQWVGSPMVLNRSFVADTTDGLEEREWQCSPTSFTLLEWAKRPPSPGSHYGRAGLVLSLSYFLHRAAPRAALSLLMPTSSRRFTSTPGGWPSAFVSGGSWFWPSRHALPRRPQVAAPGGI